MRWVHCEGLHLASIDVQAAQIGQDIRDSIHIEESLLREHGRALLVDGGRAICCVGVWPTGMLGVGQAWMLGSEECLKHPVALSRGVLALLDNEMRLYHRVQATVEVGHGAGCRFLEFLGFTYESHLRAFGPPPEFRDHWMFVRINLAGVTH